MESKLGKQGKDSNGAEKIVVAVKASKKIPKTALVWALTHVVQPGHHITLLVVVPSQSSGRKLWGFPVFARDCASAHRRSHAGASSDQKIDVPDSYSQMILRLQDLYDADKINLKVKVVFGCGAVATEAKGIQASWVILDKQLKHEEKLCMEDLQCNIVVMSKLKPKVLRVNLVGSSKKEPEPFYPLRSNQSSDKQQKSKTLRSVLGLVATAASSPDLFTTTEAGTSSLSSSDQGTSPFFIPEINGSIKGRLLPAKEDQDSDEPSSDTDSENFSTSSPSLGYPIRVSDIVTSASRSGLGFRSWMADMEENSQSSNNRQATSTKYGHELGFSGNVREAVFLTRNSPSVPPPLCSICQHKAPVFGKPPKWFTYAELALATGGFSRANFLAEGGFGSVHRGVLPDGQAVAIKQHKPASSQGDQEFCSEVEVLSCAQHRNVVMLVGLCIEGGKRLLVYEYVCNRSLDYHLYGHHRDPLEWSARQKIAVGAARGLRYLHEECRVGCIVHRDMRPNNILITHDFEPLVGDFGLARWQKDGNKGVETRVIGTFGYLAPEYTQSGQITEKADVYSFGVVLVELVTGRKAVDLNRPKGQQCLAEWARPLLEEYAVDELVDPRLGNSYSEQEVYCMLHASSLCIRPDPHSRPRMSQVLHILEGNMIIDTSFNAGTSSGSLCPDQQQQEQYTCDLMVKEAALGGFSRKLCIDTVRHGLRERYKAGKGSNDDDC